MCGWSPLLPLETIMALLIGYTLIRTVKFFFFKRKTRINSIIKNTGNCSILEDQRNMTVKGNVGILIGN